MLVTIIRECLTRDRHGLHRMSLEIRYCLYWLWLDTLISKTKYIDIDRTYLIICLLCRWRTHNILFGIKCCHHQNHSERNEGSSQYCCTCKHIDPHLLPQWFILKIKMFLIKGIRVLLSLSRGEFVKNIIFKIPLLFLPFIAFPFVGFL